MNLYKGTTVGLVVGMIVACGAAGSDPSPVAHAAEAGASNDGACSCTVQPGPPGQVGPQGPQGPAGKDSVCAPGMGQCPAGVAGPAGPAGIAGPKGNDGSSCSASGGGDAVHVSCSDGSSATLNAPAALKGDKGEPGAKGDVGVQGPAGGQGAPGKDGKDGTAITKQNVYARAGAASSGTSYAYCDDNNDVLLTGGCNGSAPMAFSGPLATSEAATKSAWQCTRWGLANPGESVVATVVCLEVP